MTRIALYCHDALGLDHTRRTLSLARSLSELTPSPDILVLSGAQEAPVLPRPTGCDVLRLPGLVKQGRERYAARDLPAQRLPLSQGQSMWPFRTTGRNLPFRA